MSLPRFSVRSLCLLVLFQLVAGPLVLVTVLTFCQVTVREAPQHGIAKAVGKAWQSHEVQAVLDAADKDKGDNTKSPLPKESKSKGKITGIEWHPVVSVLSAPLRPASPLSRGRAWTPAWPQAPPGTPPRVG